ncbi:hypothetical protein CBR_g33981 [Chara braunii]|uniref:DUF659 domain-containing protein n=1 Tax=Chara braunii TaxID=69332 RepID=A0A388LHQ9_CHABU|nr:hypothetical protein CBR_g33981 [Chara braunii]|eukprot:GBG81801.1 hypothetical protein CBR_g33981 [Chara braunii]
MPRADIAFNFLNFDTTHALQDAHLEVANARLKVKLPTYKHMRTVMSNYMYLKVEKTLNPMNVCWDKNGCTFMTDGSTDRKNRPVMDILAAGEKGVVLVTTVHMTGRKKNAAALTKLWEQVMREIELHRINVICTDNREVNKKERRTDRDFARIPWVLFGAHCCSLLLKDLTNLAWVKDIAKTADIIVKFTRKHHATNGLMMTIDESLTLLHPAEVYQMFERLLNREDALTEMMDGKFAARWRALRWSGKKLQRKVDLVYFTVQSESWWVKVKKVVAFTRRPALL